MAAHNLRSTPHSPPTGLSLTRLSRIGQSGQTTTRSAVGPRKHKIALVDNDDSTFGDVLEDEL